MEHSISKINFRSHKNILEIANCLVSLIEIFFPKTIDKLKKEISNLDGPKPVVFVNNDLELLVTCLFGSINPNKIEKTLNFGCN